MDHSIIQFSITAWQRDCCSQLQCSDWIDFALHCPRKKSDPPFFSSKFFDHLLYYILQSLGRTLQSAPGPHARLWYTALVRQQWLTKVTAYYLRKESVSKWAKISFLLINVGVILDYLKVLPTRDDKINQHLPICHELFDAQVDFSITEGTCFQLRQLGIHVCDQITDTSYTSCKRRSHSTQHGEKTTQKKTLDLPVLHFQHSP